MKMFCAAAVLALCGLCGACSLNAQTPASPPAGATGPGQPADAIAQLQSALVGSWSGVLEYRDYQSNAHVKLPTWLTIDRTATGLLWRYLYDDGPSKVVSETDALTLSFEPPVWSSLEQEKQSTTKLSILGLQTLKSGRGTLTLTGTATENGHPVETRTLVHVTRNLLEMTRETRAEGADFQFRDGYTLTRRLPPTP